MSDSSAMSVSTNRVVRRRIGAVALSIGVVAVFVALGGSVIGASGPSVSADDRGVLDRITDSVPEASTPGTGLEESKSSGTQLNPRSARKRYYANNNPLG